MDLTMRELWGRRRSRRDERRTARLDEENERLRTELRMTRSELDRERDRERGVIDALNRASGRKTKITAKPGGGLMRLVAVGGAAYIVGTKAGRGRDEPLRAWPSEVADRIGDPPVDASSPGIGPRPNPLTESGIRPRRYGSIDASARRSA